MLSITTIVPNLTRLWHSISVSPFCTTVYVTFTLDVLPVLGNLPTMLILPGPVKGFFLNGLAEREEDELWHHTGALENGLPKGRRG